MQRGAISHEKDDSGRVHILQDESETLQDDAQDSYSTPAQDALVDQLRSEVEYLRDQLEQTNTRDWENRRLLAAALERRAELKPVEHRKRGCRT